MRCFMPCVLTYSRINEVKKQIRYLNMYVCTQFESTLDINWPAFLSPSSKSQESIVIF